MPLPTTSPPSNHRRHRKRISALRLSSDTTATLPAYIPVQSAQEDSDRPPDYPDSAEEADSEDSGTRDPYPTLSSPSLIARKSLSRRSSIATPPSSSRRIVSAQSHRRKKSWAHPLPPSQSEDEDTTDPYLDALLARSVHALEMSNTLLQSTIATQTSLSDAVAAADEFPSSPSTTLSLRLTGAEGPTSRKGKASRWADEIAQLSMDVDNLFEGPSSSSRTLPSDLVSSSLPTPSALSTRHRRLPPSLDLRHESQLTFTEHDRSQLVAPPPRALTQYIASSSTPYLPGTDELVSLPSTLGLRASSSVSHLPLSPQPPAGSLQLSSNMKLHSAISSPRVTDKHHEPSTPAYNMLASFVARPSPQPPPNLTLSSSPFTPSKLAFLAKSRSRSSSSSVPRGTSRTGSGDTVTGSSRSDGAQTPERPSRSVTPKLSFACLPSSTSSTFQTRRPMTPPVEESSNSSSGSGSDGEGRQPKAKLTVQCLRKILDDHAQVCTASQVNASTMTVSKLKAPAFQPRTPARTPSSAGTSTTTASVSRLFTRNKHLLTAGGPPTHSPSPSISTPGAGPSSAAGGAGTDTPPLLSTSPPRRGALKGSRANSQVNTPTGSVPPSPGLTPAPSTSGGTNALGGSGGSGFLNPAGPPSASLAAWAFLTKGASGSRTPTTPGSGRSTPKRISFAELPEAYNSGADEDVEEEEEVAGGKGKGKAKAKKPAAPQKPKRQPGESSERFRQQREGRRQRRRREQRLARTRGDGSSSDSSSAGLRWWNWIVGIPSATGANGRRYEDRVEDRLTRGGMGVGSGFGGAGGMGGGGEWGV